MRHVIDRAVHRRLFIQLAAASASLAACSPLSTRAPRHVAVVGGGIIGASIAWHLAREGARVTLLERDELATRASRGTFAWVNASWAKQPRQYHGFNQLGVSGWQRLQEELAIPVRWGGSLEWFANADRQARLAEQIAEQAAWGEPARMIAADEFAALEPGVRLTGAMSAAFSANDGAIDPVLATRRLVQAAEALGARVQTGCAVTGARSDGQGGVTVQTNCGEVAADRFVLASGADPDAVEALTSMTLPQRSTPGVIVVTRPMPRLINRIIVAPGVHIHQRDDGRIVLGEQDGAPGNDAHARRLAGRPNRFPDPAHAQQHAQRILAVAEDYVPAIRDAHVEDVHIGWRPLPVDGHPVLGAPASRPEAYLAIMHSGVSLAPVVGELVAREILSGQDAAELAPYRPDRSFETIRRY